MSGLSFYSGRILQNFNSNSLIRIFYTFIMISISWGCSGISYIHEKSQKSVASPTLPSAPLSASPSSSTLNLLKTGALNVTGGTPPYSYSVIEGTATVSPAGVVKSDKLGNIKIKVTDSLGSETTVDLAVQNNTLLTGLDVKSVEFNSDKSKILLGVLASTTPYSYHIYTADIDLLNGTISTPVLLNTVANIPNLNRICSTPLMNSNATKIVFSAETSVGLDIGECEIWSMDYDGQNAIQISEELPGTGIGFEDLSPEEIKITEDGLRVVYKDGLNPNYSDNEKDLKIVNLDGTNLHYLHPSLNNDWGVINHWFVPGGDRVIFNYVKPGGATDYRTYSARLDGSDFGALVPLSSNAGEVDINSKPLFFSNYTKVYFSNSKNAALQQTIEVANIDGTGRSVIQAGAAGVAITILDVNEAGRIVYFRSGNDVITHTYGVGSVTTLSGLAGYTNPVMKVVGNKLIYLLNSGQQIRQRNLDGSGDELLSDAAYVGKIRGVLFHTNGDIYYYGDKDVLYHMDLYHWSATSGLITKMNSTPLIGALTGLFVNRIGFLASSSIYLEICPGTINFGTWSCNSTLNKMAFDLDGSVLPSSDYPSIPSTFGSDIFVSPLQTIRLIYGSTGLSLQWFGL